MGRTFPTSHRHGPLAPGDLVGAGWAYRSARGAVRPEGAGWACRSARGAVRPGGAGCAGARWELLRPTRQRGPVQVVQARYQRPVGRLEQRQAQPLPRPLLRPERHWRVPSPARGGWLAGGREGVRPARRRRSLRPAAGASRRARRPVSPVVRFSVVRFSVVRVRFVRVRVVRHQGLAPEGAGRSARREGHPRGWRSDGPRPGPARARRPGGSSRAAAVAQCHRRRPLRRWVLARPPRRPAAPDRAPHRQLARHRCAVRPGCSLPACSTRPARAPGAAGLGAARAGRPCGGRGRPAHPRCSTSGCARRCRA